MPQPVSFTRFAIATVSCLLLGSCHTEPKPRPQPEEALLMRGRSALKPHLKQGVNRDIAFFVDLTRPSGQNRFFVLDLRHNQVLAQGLCCNGRTDAQGRVLYSNTYGSNCSSHGAAKVSYRYRGQFGKAYKLEGLEQSNSNLFKRAVVLHAHSCIPEAPQQAPICVSEGCPTVSPAFLETLAAYIDHSAQPILLYIE
ncbi:murein L,D-transpeptidase catalytic domain-containing protein [Hymenobacter saemangeumensis]